MNPAFNEFLEELTNENLILIEPIFFVKAAVFLEEQLESYLNIEGQHAHSLRSLIESARKLKNEETDKAFWRALLAFNSLIEAALETSYNHHSKNKWLRFINIIENLQGYNGTQVFKGTNLKEKRKLRLYFAYMLTWEHLRYLAGNEDDYSPSSEILNAYSDHGDHEHEDHDHDHEDHHAH